MGKKKIDIKKINNKNYLKATFSKRRKGLFRKATDLCCLTASQIAIIAFSPGNKPFLFGHPSAESVIDQFLSEQTSCTTNYDEHDKDQGLEDVDGDDDLEANQDEEMKESEDGVEEVKVRSWWEEPIDEKLGLNELQNYKVSLEGLKENVAWKLDEMNRREFCTKDYFSTNCDSEIGSSTSSTNIEETDLCD